MNKKITKILFILTFITSSSYAWFWDKSLSDYKNDFKDKVFEVREQQSETQTNLKETKHLIFTFASLLQESKKEDIKFNKLHNNWLDTKSEIKILEDKFVSLVGSADTYFNEVKKKADEISDKKLQASAINKILISENNYINRLKITKNGLIQLSVAHQKLKDLIIFLEISNSLKSLEQELNNRFSKIDIILTSVMKDLDLLYKDSQNLLDTNI